MESTKTISFGKLNDTSIYLLTSLIVTLFLFYIDEGYYNFKWMANVGAWIIFVIYVAIFLLTQLGFNFLTARFLSSQVRRTLSLLVGVPVGVIFLILIFYQSLEK